MPSRSTFSWLLTAVIVAVILLIGLKQAGLSAQTTTAPASALSNTVSPTATGPGESPAGNAELPSLDKGRGEAATSIARAIELHTVIPNRPRVDVTTYTVQPGDNLFLIADRYGLQPETILWGNYDILRDNPQFLKPDQELNILPVDGTYYQWTKGDTLEKVADFFEVSPDAILEYPGNHFDLVDSPDDSVQVAEGDWLIIPGGRRALQDWGPPAITRSNPASASYYGSGSCGSIYEGAIGIGTFIWPTIAKTLSGYDYNPNIHPGIDIAGPEGNSVFAVDSGVVVYAGWSEYGYGNLIVLDHGNGWQSAYAHLSVVGVYCGQSVAQGTTIGAVGSTGNSTGPHLHFELRSEIYGKVNPWDYLIP